MSTFPTTGLTPIVAFNFDGSQSQDGVGDLPYKVLFIGGLLAAGSLDEGRIDLVTSAAMAEEYYGVGSQLARMCAAYFAANPKATLYCGGLADAGAGVAATGLITLAGTATAAGTINLWIAGKKVTVAVAVGDAHTDLDADVAAAINADTDLPVTATDNEDGTIGLTARHKGEAGNDIDVRVSYGDGEAVPAGLTVTIAAMGDTGSAMTAGATNPDVTTITDLIGEDWYQVIAMPYVDATNLTAIEAVLDAQWGADVMHDGHVFVGKVAASVAVLASWGNGRNSKHVTSIGCNGIPNTPEDVAAVVAAVVATEGSADPARPFQTLSLTGILAPTRGSDLTRTERELLLLDGIATIVPDGARAMRIERLVTMYQTNGAGAADPTYRDLNTKLTLMHLRYETVTHLQTRYPRAKLASSDAGVGPEGGPVVTPGRIKNEMLGLCRTWISKGWVEDYDSFKDGIVVQRKMADPNVVEVLATPDLMNQLRSIAGTFQFKQ